LQFSVGVANPRFGGKRRPYGAGDGTV